MIDLGRLVVDHGEVVVFYALDRDCRASCVMNSNFITGPLSGGVALEERPDSLKNSGIRRGCRVDGVTVRRPALSGNSTTFIGSHSRRLSIPAPQPPAPRAGTASRALSS